MENTDMGTRIFRVHYDNGTVKVVTVPMTAIVATWRALDALAEVLPTETRWHIGTAMYWASMARMFALHPEVATGYGVRNDSPKVVSFQEIDEFGNDALLKLKNSDGSTTVFPMSEIRRGLNY